MSKFSACGRQVLPAVGTCQWHERFYFIKETFKSLTTFWSLLNVSKTPPSPVKPRGSGWTVSTHERRSHDRFGSNRVSTRCKKSDGTVVKPPESVGKPPSTPLPPCGINSRGAMLSRADSSLHCVSFGMTIDTIYYLHRPKMTLFGKLCRRRWRNYAPIVQKPHHSIRESECD